MTAASTPTTFLMVTCQPDAQAALKAEMAHNWPEFRLAYSRRGFVTYRLPARWDLEREVDLRAIFARAYALGLGQATGETIGEKAESAWKLFGPTSTPALHVWHCRTGTVSTAVQAELDAEVTAARDALAAARQLDHVNQVASNGQHVLDCVVVAPGEWWIGRHQATSRVRRYAGGVFPLQLPEEAISRAYLKVAEALAWSRLPVRPGDHCVEIGAAPGGTSQALLDRQLHVTGIDPAEMDPAVLRHPNFRHLRMRGADLKRREYAGFRWLLADMNVAPRYTLDVVEGIATHRAVKLQGLLLTLKLLDWSLAEQIPSFLERIRGWGFRDIRARQLVHNRQEICVAALRHRALRRVGRGKK